jgi:phosphatidylserine decarboxylase
VKFHKEGKLTILIALTLLIALNIVIHISFDSLNPFVLVISLLSAFGLFVILNFFRNPFRTITPNELLILSPADGTVVSIEETEETEFLKDKRLLVSVFMSVWNVHINRFPVSGKIVYSKYRPGKYLLARNPKSSELNEAHTTVIESKNKLQIALRQIAGVMARRVVCYAKEGKYCKQGEELGFIKFGSRVDIFLPVDTPLNVKIGERVKGNMSVIARVEK